MKTSEFSPGFRISSMDIVVLATGVIGFIGMGTQIWRGGMIVALVVLHFFLFCNVFRISRASELIWSAAFIVLAGSTIFSGFPGWVATSLVAISLSSFLIWRETRKVDYHGICWRKWNPGLPDWWKTQQETDD